MKVFMGRSDIVFPPVIASLAGSIRRGGTFGSVPARVAIVLAALALASCATCDAACADGMSWSAVVPEGTEWSEVQAGSIRVCRNDECVSGALSGLSVVHSSRQYAYLDGAGTDGGAGVQLYAERQADSIVLGLDYFERMAGIVADGDRYTIEILAADGTPIMGLAETAVTYDRNPISCNDLVCLNVSLEGNTL